MRKHKRLTFVLALAALLAVTAGAAVAAKAPATVKPAVAAKKEAVAVLRPSGS